MKPSPNLPVRVYSPDPALRSPRVFFADMFRDIGLSRELAVALARRDLNALYRQSIFGYLWAFLPVIATTAVFLYLRAGGVFETGEQAIAYPVYLLVGTVLWQVFADAVQGPLKVITSSRAMLVKINFPREAIIIAAMWITLFNFLVRLAILVPALVWFGSQGQFELSWSLLWFPVGVIGVILLGYTIGVLLTPIGMLYKDISMGITIVLNFWMFLSPVVVTIPADGFARTVMLLNPVTPVIECARAWLVGVPTDLVGAFALVCGISLAFLAVGWIAFRLALPHVIARLGM